MEFYHTLIASFSMYNKLLMKKLYGTGLTLGQPKILNYLKNHAGSTQTEIATACFIETASMTSALNGMEAKGLIERRRQNGNKRTYYIYLTPQGEKMCDVIATAFEEIRKEIFKNIPKEKSSLFIEIFKEIYEKMLEII